jgi:amino acid permease
MITKNYVAAVAMLISSTVGVGMFTLPFLSIKAGVLTIIAYFIILGCFQHWLHTLYAEIILSTKKQHRLPGYAEKYLGAASKKILLFLSMFSGYGALLAYTIIGGEFLFQLLSPYFGGSLLVYTVLLLSLRSLITLFGFAWVTRAEVILTGGLIGSIIVIAAIASGEGIASNLVLFNPSNIMLAYGPVFFAVSGMLAVNDICLIMAKEKDKIISTLRSGIIISIAIMVLFIIAIASISGTLTSPDALSGLQSFIDPLFFKVLLIIGLVTVTTAFFAVAEAMEEMFVWDYKLKRHIAWFLVSAVPLFLFLIGAQDVTKVIAITGALSGGLLGGYYLLLALRVKAKPEIKSPIKVTLTPLIALSVTILLIAGLGYQLWEIFG